ncbi:related to Proteasome-interacting protein CIC1 [Zygosaccharomyces bailii]|nr:related to Proteasome-interacting protein CIC1 [Zygosaccharomyces bailii]
MGKKSRSGAQKSQSIGTPTKASPNGKLSAKNSPKASPKSTPKGSPKSTLKGSPKSTPKSTPKGSPKRSPKTSKNAKLSKEQTFRSRVVHTLDQLRNFEDKQGEDDKTLLGGDEELGRYIQLIAVNNSSFTGSNKKFKPRLLDIKHSLYQAWQKASVTMVKDFKILLVLKDADAGKVEPEQIVGESEGAPSLTIVTAKDLKTKYKAFEARRAFISDFSLILSDDSVITALPKLLGNKAYSKVETTPIPIRTHANKEFSLAALQNHFRKIYDSKLPVILPRGTTLNIHLGHLDWFNTEQLADNVESIVNQLKDSYKIRSIFVKCNDSPAVPLYYNQDVLDEISKVKEEKPAVEKNNEVEIDGVKVNLSAFDSALAEVADPQELKSIFHNKVKSAKRSKPEEPNPAPKAKKAKA